MAKLYIATAYGNRAEAQALQALLKAQGHTLSHDWTTQTDPTVAGLEDFNGVMKADCLVVIAHPEMRDTLAELGIALGSGKAVYVLGAERAKRSVFYPLCVLVTGVAELVEVLRD